MTASAALRGLALLAVLPAVLAAADPVADVRACRGSGGDPPGDPPDLIRARGQIVELGTSARWILTFAEPLRVPDRSGHPFRVDIVLHDPEVPALSFGYYRNANRLVRVDATVERPTEIYLLPERASNVFNPPVIEGRTMRIQVPGRTLSDDEDLTGTSPGLQALRWTVIVRDESACDFLDGRPTRRLVPVEDPVAPPTEEPPAPAPPGAVAAWVVPAAAVAVLGLLALASIRRGR